MLNINQKDGLKLNIQPIIVKTVNGANVQEVARDRYFLNYNCMKMDWFNPNFLLQDSNNLFLLEEDTGNPMDDAINSIVSEHANNTDGTVWDAPRIFFLITPAIAENDSIISNFITTILADEDAIWNGNERGLTDLVLGQDYFLNDTLYNYLTAEHNYNDELDITLDDYLKTDGSINTNFWEELNDNERDYTNLKYYGLKNDNKTSEFTIDELCNFYSTFCGIILNNTQIDEETLATNINQIYNAVLHYFYNFKSDIVVKTLKLILGTSYKQAPDGYTSCNCSSSNGFTSGNIIVSCSTQYDNAMLEYVKTMLGDGQFYCDWMYENKGKTPSDGLITKLQNLIIEFLKQDFNLTFNKKSTFSCSCITNTDENEANRKIMENYLKVLEWVKNKQIEQNINKIKVFGESFGELLPKLQF